ncbi:MAG: division/cell wall cluster transcriptional repressor MraZ [Ignavibacteriaceae bacterium]
MWRIEKNFLDFTIKIPLFWGVVGKSGKVDKILGKFLFKGQYTYSVDSKGRVSIPSRLRKFISTEANDTLVMTKGTAKCIDVYPQDEWQKFEAKLDSLNTFLPKDSKFIRILLQNASEDTLDAQSRILIPQHLLEYAKIEKEVLILGVLKKIELWSPKVYADYLEGSSETYEQIAAEVMAK